jgi:hypothetical protein
MATREAEALLKKNGFAYVRTTKTGEFWEDSHTRILVGPNLTGRNFHNFEADVKKAIRKRPDPNLSVVTAPVPGQYNTFDNQYFQKRDREKEMQIRTERDHHNTQPMTVKLGSFALHGSPQSKPTPSTTSTAEQHAREQAEFARKQLQQESQERQPERRIIQPAVLKIQPAVVEQKLETPAVTETPEAEVKKSKTRRKLTKDDRYALWTRILELKKSGFKSGDITTKITEEKFRMPNGAPVRLNYVSNIISLATRGHGPMGIIKSAVEGCTTGPVPANIAEVLRGSDKADVIKQTKPIAQSAKLPESVVAILTDPDMPTAKKIRMLQYWKANSTLNAVMKDPDLNDDDKIGMLAAYVD